MRRVLPVILLVFLLSFPSIVICAVGTDNAIEVVSRREGINARLIVDVLTLVVLLITTIVIGWYSYETRKLRIATEKAREESEKAREIEYHPWLVGSDLVIDPDPTPAIYLPVTNVGKTPAFDVSFVSEFYFFKELRPSLSHRLGFIAPNDTAHFRIVSLGNTPREPLGESISVTISYSTHLKGAGVTKQDFENIEGGWMNKGGGNYTFTLSTGEVHSR